MLLKHSISLILLSIIMLSCILFTIEVDKYLTDKQLNKIVDRNSRDFSVQVKKLHDEIYVVLAQLIPPVRCDAELFENLIYQYKHIKNIGVIKDDVITCDVYQGKLLETKVNDYHSFTYEDGETYKYWMRDEYMTIANPHGYFVEYDMNYYLDFIASAELSGFSIFGRQTLKQWFDFDRHKIDQKDKEKLNALMANKFEQLNKDDSRSKIEYLSDDVVFHLVKTDKGSVVASYTHKDYIPSWQVVRLSHIVSALLFGFILSFAILYRFYRGRTLKQLLVSAIKSKDIYMAYQPLVDLNNGNYQVIGFEALVRWQLKNGDHIRPDIFIPLAEESGLTKKLTACIIELIFKDLHPILLKNPALYVGINITPTDLHDMHLVDQLHDNIKKYHLSPSQVVVELTERVITSPQAQDSIKALQRAGIRISIDDFGTGASNVKYLAELDPDVIKIDRSFVVWSDGEGPTSQLLGKLIEMCKEFEVKIVVEGIETIEQANRCEKLGADVGQGYYWYKPVKVSELNLPKTEDKP